MQTEDRTFRRMVTEALVDGPQYLTGHEFRSALGIGGKMVTAAKKTKEERINRESEARNQGRPLKSRIVSSAMERRRKTSKYLEKRSLIQRFFEENSTPTSRRRDVIRTKVNKRCIDTHSNIGSARAYT